MLLVTGCATTPPPSPSATPTASPSPTATPVPTPSPPTAFPLAVVTGITNRKPTITLGQLVDLAHAGSLVVPCGVEIRRPAVPGDLPCIAADEIAATLQADQSRVALLPPGLVEPATKVLPIAGAGPFGLFGPDLFGDPEARAMPYPVIGVPAADDSDSVEPINPAWTAYDASQVWTLTAIGSLCADRIAAYYAVVQGKGWDWPFSGGTARYTGAPYMNPNPPAGIGQFPIVNPVETGNDGATATISRRSDVALADHKCPILPNDEWAPNLSGLPSLSVPEAVLTRWESLLGIDAVYLPADHQSDRGVHGIQSTLTLLDQYGFPHTGLGMDLDQALQPAYVEVAGLKVAFVSWNDVPAPVHAGPGTPGVAWLTQENVDTAVKLARDGGADLVICDPQWWGGSEYHQDLWSSQQTALGWMDQAGCDQVIAGGLHVSGDLFLRPRTIGVSLVDAGPGNYMYGQPWWQETQEGVILDLTFRGKALVNVRLHPYVMILSARPTLLDPEGDGHYVLDRIWDGAQLEY